MQVILPSIVAVLGTLLGAVVAGLLQQRTSARANRSATSEKRRDEFASAVSTFASAVMSLRRAEHNRAKARLTYSPGEARELERQETYGRRTEAHSAYYKLKLFADPDNDRQMIEDAEAAIELVRSPEDAASLRELEEASHHTRRAVDKVVDAANVRLREWRPATRS